MKIQAPDKTFTGESRYGDLVLNFKDGVAEHDGDLPAPIRSYMASTGYGLDGDAPVQPDAPQGVDHGPEQRVGTPLADAAARKPEDNRDDVGDGDGDGEDGDEDESELFDPSAHTVEEVNEHLAGADLDERERVLQAEAEGKGRTTILTGPYSDLSGKD